MVEMSDSMTGSDEANSQDGTRVNSPPAEPQTDKLLKFSIENILRPEFGVKNAVSSVKPTEKPATNSDQTVWPAWVYCTRYSDRPSSGPRTKRIKKKEKTTEDKRPRTAFSGEQLARLKTEFNINRYLTERRRQALASELGLNEAQIKIWFQNKRAKIKKASGSRNPLALQLMAQGLYNHSTVPLKDD